MFWLMGGLHLLSLFKNGLGSETAIHSFLEPLRYRHWRQKSSRCLILLRDPTTPQNNNRQILLPPKNAHHQTAPHQQNKSTFNPHKYLHHKNNTLTLKPSPKLPNYSKHPKSLYGSSTTSKNHLPNSRSKWVGCQLFWTRPLWIKWKRMELRARSC